MIASVDAAILQRFELEAIAGEGGMGTVYRARDRQNGYLVALKLLHSPPHTAAREHARFVREVTFLAQLRHPNIASYIEHGETPGGQKFVVMEWLDGMDLHTRLGSGPLSVAEAVKLARQIGQALATAHSRGIVHRDLKPSNLFLRRNSIDSMVLLDFGIARHIEHTPVVTRTGAVVGTLEYMAPEQARGDRNIGTSSDIFALGCVLFEALTGHPPFSSENAVGLFAKILLEEVPSARSLRPSVPADLAELLDRMLAKDPQRRPRDAAALLDELAKLKELPPEDDSASLPALGNNQLTAGEQLLVSVVVAAPPAMSDGIERTLTPSEVQEHDKRRNMLRDVFLRYGAKDEVLANGIVIAMLKGVGTATDQAMQAARCALAVQEQWPGALVSLATGRALFRNEIAPAGEAIDRAVKLLHASVEHGLTSARPASAAPATPTGVHIDDISGGLLDARFVITRTALGLVLHFEQETADEARPLLRKPTTCVGRDQELATLDATLTGCIEESQSCVVVVVAPPGIGKSRLRHEFLRRLERQKAEAAVLYGRGDLMSAGSPYGMVGQALRRMCAIASSEPATVQQRKLSERIGRYLRPGDTQRIVSFLAEVCGVPMPDDGNALLRAARQDPTIMGEQVSQAFVQWLRAECSQRLQLLVLEDLHWGDAPTVRLVDVALRELSTQPFMCLALARPEVQEKFPTLWAERRGQEIHLSGLSKRASEKLVQQILGKQVSRSTMERIVERAGGNALYLEELVRAESEGKGEALPETVLAMLQARLMRLEPGARRVLRAASILGETFWPGALLALLGRERAASEVNSWLQFLIASELIIVHPQSRIPGEKEYGFRHALVRDAAYAMLTDSDRQLGHRLASIYLEQAGEGDSMVLAEHAYLAGDVERAMPLFVRGAELSMERYDSDGAVARTSRGIAAGATGELLGKLKAMQFQARFWGGDMKTSYQAGADSLQLLPHGSMLWCKTIYMMFTAAIHSNQPSELQRLTELFLGASPVDDARCPYVDAASYMVVMYSLLGLHAPASVFRERMLAVGKPIEDVDVTARGAMHNASYWYLRIFEPRPYTAWLLAKESVHAFTEIQDQRRWTMACIALGLALSELGDFASSKKILCEALEMTTSRRDPFITVNVQVYLAWVLSQSADPGDLVMLREQALAAVEANVSPPYTGMAKIALARMLLTHGTLASAEAEARTAINLLRMMPPYAAEALIVLARVLLQQNRIPEARLAADEAIQIVTSIGGASYQSVSAFLTSAKIWHAEQNAVAAQQALREACKKLQQRVEDIPDVLERQRFLTQVPENLMTQTLADAWLGQGDG